MAKHILYLSYDGLTDPLGSSQVLPYILGLEKRGYTYTVISFEKPERFSEGKKAVEEEIAHKNITWIPLVYHKNPPILSTVLDIRKLKKTISKRHAEHPIDLMHCRSYITSIAGLYFKKKWGIPFVFDMRAFYADERADAGLWPKNHFLYGKVYRYFKQKEKEFLQAADYSIVLTHAGEKIIAEGELTGKSVDGKTMVIPCCADMRHFDYNHIQETEKAVFRKELNITEKTFVLGYSGSVGTWYMLPEMMAFYKEVLRQKPDSLFLILSRDSKAHILSEANKQQIPETNMHIRAVGRKDMPTWLSVFDYSIFFILPSFSKQASSPTKQGELMGLGIPVICNANVGDTESIVTRSSGGIVIRRFDDGEYAKAVSQALSTAIDREKIREQGIAYYGLEDGINKYEQVYEEVLGR